MLFFPGGNPAAGASIDISLDGSNQIPLMFADQAATIPVSSPIVADAMGNIFFYAAPGLYVAELSGSFFRIGVHPSYSAPVWPDVWVHMQTVAATVWTIDHYFGTKPSVSIDLGTSQVEAEVDHPSLTQTVLTFTSAQTGAAYLRR
jgi:hypothetical protein